MGEVHSKLSGFTLLEILVVLAIVGLLAGVALPGLHKVAQRVEISNQRTDLKLRIERLGYQAYLSGMPIVLGASESGPVAARSGSGGVLVIPTGWQVQVLQPVRYAVNGVCNGGKLVITDPEGNREGFQLKAPQCRLHPIEILD